MSKSLEKLGKLSVREFFARFPDDEACLKHIMEVRYGLRHECKACGKYRTFHKLEGRPAFSCAECRAQIHPCAGTVFQDSRTPLTVWFYAIYLFVATRHGVSGKELERTLGVTYKCAYRIGMQIRKLMAKADGFEMLKGHIELDEAYVGGRRRNPAGPRGLGRGTPDKTIIFGMVERGGRKVAEVIPNVKSATIREAVLRNVKRGSTISTDEYPSYNLLKRDQYRHLTVEHGAKQWTRWDERGEKLHHTNTVESFWSLFKNSIRSTHIHVSPEYMDVYLKEFTFRSNHRQMQNAMFDLLIAAV